VFKNAMEDIRLINEGRKYLPTKGINYWIGSEEHIKSGEAKK